MRITRAGGDRWGRGRRPPLYFTMVLNAFNAFRDPVVYTPGDNEWTDCHRANNGGYVPTERLDTIRSMFFAQPGATLGMRPARVESQGAPVVENVMWQDKGVQFATVHVVGSNNDWLPWFNRLPRSPEQVAEYTARNAANVAWIHRVFSTARATGAPGVVIGIQADMWDAAFSGANADPASYDRFTDTVRALADEARAYGKPVLLLNGDSHAFTDDAPLSAAAPAYQRTMYGVTAPVPNLRRITVNGSTTPCHEWLRLDVSGKGGPAMFQVTRERFTRQPGMDPALCPAG